MMFAEWQLPSAAGAVFRFRNMPFIVSGTSRHQTSAPLLWVLADARPRFLHFPGSGIKKKNDLAFSFSVLENPLSAHASNSHQAKTVLSPALIL